MGPSRNRIGQRFGQYEITDFLGRGGFADVFLGRNVHLPQQEVAIKVLDKEVIQSKSQQFKNEAAIILSLHHQHIIQFYTYDILLNSQYTVTPYPYIVMEYAPQGSLRSKHPRGKPLELTTIVTYMQQIASALQYSHGNQVMHLDVKPENILVNSQGKLLLSDFGIAALVTEQEKAADIQGTLSYMAPEQIRGRPDKASDQYALGVLVYEWICGKLPFSGRTIQEHVEKLMNHRPPSLTAQLPTLSSAVEAVVMKALSKQIQDRYASVQQFAQELEKAITQPVSHVKLLAHDPNINMSPPALPAPQGKQFWGMPDPQAQPSFPIGMNAGNQVPSIPDSQTFSPSGMLPFNQAAPAPNPQAFAPSGMPLLNQVPSVPDSQAFAPSGMPPLNQAAPAPNPQALVPSGMPPLNQAAPAPNPQAFAPSGMPPLNQVPSVPDSQELAALLSGGIPLNQVGAIPDPQSASPFLTGMPPGNQAGAMPDQQNSPQAQGGMPPGNQVGAIPDPQSPSPFLVGKPTANQAGGAPNLQASPFPGGAAPAPSPFFGGNLPVNQQAGPGSYTSSSSSYWNSQTISDISPPVVPPYLRSGSGTNNYNADSYEHSFTQIIGTFVQPRNRRRLSASFMVGIATMTIGSIFIGLWLGKVESSYGNETAWWGFIISLVCSVGAFWLFDLSRNKMLKGSLSLVLAIFWGFVGYAIAILTGAGTHGGFLPDENVLSVVFFLGSLILYIWITFRRK